MLARLDPFFSHMYLVLLFPSSPWTTPWSTTRPPWFFTPLVFSSAAATSSGGAENRARRHPKAARPLMASRTSGGGCIGLNEIGTFTFTATCSVVEGGSVSGALPARVEPVAPTNPPAPGACLDPDLDDGERPVLDPARSSASVGGRRCSIGSCSESSLSTTDPERLRELSLLPIPPPIRESMARPTTLQTPVRNPDETPESTSGPSSESSPDSLSAQVFGSLSACSRLPVNCFGDCRQDRRRSLRIRATANRLYGVYSRRADIERQTNAVLCFTRPTDTAEKTQGEMPVYPLAPPPSPATGGRKSTLALPVENVSALSHFPRLPILFALSSVCGRRVRAFFCVASLIGQRPPADGGELLPSPSRRRLSERATAVEMVVGEAPTRGHRGCRSFRSVSIMRCPSRRIVVCRRCLRRNRGGGGGDGMRRRRK